MSVEKQKSSTAELAPATFSPDAGQKIGDGEPVLQGRDIESFPPRGGETHLLELKNNRGFTLLGREEATQLRVLGETLEQYPKSTIIGLLIRVKEGAHARAEEQRARHMVGVLAAVADRELYAIGKDAKPQAAKSAGIDVLVASTLCMGQDKPRIPATVLGLLKPRAKILINNDDKITSISDVGKPARAIAAEQRHAA